MKLTAAQIKAIAEMKKDRLYICKMNDNVKGALKKKGLLHVDENNFWNLTEAGKAAIK